MVGRSPANCNLNSSVLAIQNVRRRTVALARVSISGCQFSPDAVSLVAPQTHPVLESQQSAIPRKIMAISQDLLEMLVCPLCKVPVKLLDDQSGLKCPACRRVYPVRDDIPVMLLEEASIANE